MRKKLLRALSLICLLLFLSAMVQAQYKFYTIPSSAFRPGIETMEYFNNWDYSYLEISSPVGTLYAPIFLPQDATIISVTLSFYDNSPTGNISFSVQRTNLYTRNDQYLFSGVTSGTPGYGTIVDSSLNDGSRVVKNNSFHYTVQLYIDDTSYAGTDLRWYTVKIKYQ